MEVYIKAKVQLGISLGLKPEEATILTRKYGTNIEKIYEQLDIALQWGQSYSLCKLHTIMIYYAIHHEMAVTPVDYLMRRTSKLLFDINDATYWKDHIIKLMNDLFEWDEQLRMAYSKQLAQFLE